MKIGTYYYPEQWPRRQWDRDFDNMAAMGLQIVHMGEFAWHTMEPREGEIQLDWLGDCVRMAAQRDMKVILCTPTAAPPIWLVRDHPDVLPLDEQGTPARFGGRRHYAPTSPSLQEATVRIVTALARRFAADPTVIGWQIDNELSGAFAQNDHAHAAFRQWLRAKYGGIDALNRAWGCQFWNTFYQSFDEILLPPSRRVKYANPHACLDASRFWSQAYARFTRLQADILTGHFHENPSRPFVATNFMHLNPDVNPRDFDSLSLFAWDSYPVSGRESLTRGDAYRMGDPSSIGLMHDIMAAQRNRWALLEIQPGTINWSGVPALVHPGAVRLWLWTAFAHGAELITTYRFRQPLFGVELFHHGLMGTDGVTPSAGGEEFAQVIQEMARLDLGQTADPLPGDLSRSVGLMVDWDQYHYYLTLPQAERWNYPGLLIDWHRAIASLGLNVRICHPDEPIPGPLPLVVAPGMQMLSDAQVAHLKSYVVGGGHLVLGPRTATMDRTGQLHEGPAAEPILSLIGAEIQAYDGLPADRVAQVNLDGAAHPWNIWGELLRAAPGTQVLATHADTFYAGAAAIVHRAHARGGCTYCGVYAQGSSLYEALLKKLANQLKLPANPMPPRVRILQRGPYRIALNYQDQTVEIPAPENARFLIGARRLEPAGVAVWTG